MKTLSGGRERGLTLTEMLIATAIGAALSSMLVFVVKRQSRSYQDMKVQVTLQGQLKKAQQLLSREITNVGAGMGTTSYPFTMNSDTLTFSYIDLKAKHCSENQMVSLTYKVVPVGSKRYLVRDRKCGSTGAWKRETMVASDSAALYFWYLKPDRTTAGTQSEVKMIQYRIQLYSRNNKDSFNRIRTGIVTVWLGKT